MIPDRNFWSGRPVCVTGGTGFLGWHIVQQLLDLGARVRVCALKPSDRHPVHVEKRVETFYGDIRDSAVVSRAVAGCSVVFHTAGLVAVWGKLLEQMWSIHVDGTACVLQAADKDARIVHTSSVTTVGGTRRGDLLNEETPFNLDGTKIAYLRAKLAAELAVLQAAAEGRDAVVTNPGYLVGPLDLECSLMGRLCIRVWKGRVPVIPPGGMNLVDVRDVATGHLLAAERGKAGTRYVLGGENHRFKSFLQMMAEVADYRPRMMPPMPWLLLASVAVMAELHSKMTGREPYPSLGHMRANRYCWFATSHKAIAELGFQPRPLIESLRDTYTWHMAQESIRLRGVNRWLMRPAV